MGGDMGIRIRGLSFVRVCCNCSCVDVAAPGKCSAGYLLRGFRRLCFGLTRWDLVFPGWGAILSVHVWLVMFL